MPIARAGLRSRSWTRGARNLRIRRGPARLNRNGTVSDGHAGSGGGGAGRIRINTTSGAATIGTSAIVTPALTTACASQGVLAK